MITNTTDDKQVDNKLDFLQHLSSVKSRIKKEVTEDFIFCKLGEKDKELAIEMTVNAYQGNRLLTEMEKKAHKNNWKWDKNKECWYTEDLNEETRKGMLTFKQNLFDTIMTRVNMIAILNRNIKDNYLIRLMSGVAEEEAQEEEPSEEKTAKAVAKELMKRGET